MRQSGMRNLGDHRQGCVPELQCRCGHQRQQCNDIPKQDPYTGKTSYSISIPTVDVLDKQHMRMVRGYLDHEAGHVRFTDFTLLESLRDDPAYVMSLINIAEDIYVEREMGKRYVGCEKNLRWLSKHLFTENYDKPSIVFLKRYGTIWNCISKCSSRTP